VVIAIGSPEGARELCAKLPFPEELLFLDPERGVYKELQLNAGLKYFFSRDTADAFKVKDMNRFSAVLKRYSFIKPPNNESTLQLGGVYVVDGPKLLYGHMDKGIGAHAPNVEVLAAVASAPSA